MTIRVALADDQEMVRIGFGMILSAADDIEVVGQCADGVEALETIRRLHPDVALLDIRMPRLDGLEVARQVIDPQGAGHATRVVIVTTFGDRRLRRPGPRARGRRLPPEGLRPGAARRRGAGRGRGDPSSVRSSPCPSCNAGAGGRWTARARPASRSSRPARRR